MTRKRVADDTYGRLWRRLDELARRVDEGTLEQYRVMEILKHTLEGKMPDLFATGGLVLSELHSATIEIGKKTKESLRLCDPPGKYHLKVGSLWYVRFADEDHAPGTVRILRDMADCGVQPGTGSEFLATLERYPGLVEKWGRYQVALAAADSTAARPKCLHYERHISAIPLSLMPMYQEWWPSCYSFFVVKDIVRTD
jgi:hypothetical protein